MKGTKGPLNADIMIVGEAYGAEEETRGMPFVGASGKGLDKMLREVGIDPQACFYTNDINQRPYGNQMTKFFVPTKEAKAAGIPCVRGLYPQEMVVEGLEQLEKAIE